MPSLRHSRYYGAQEVRLVRELRDLSTPPAHGACVVASSASAAVSPRIRMDVPLEVSVRRERAAPRGGVCIDGCWG